MPLTTLNFSSASSFPTGSIVKSETKIISAFGDFQVASTSSYQDVTGTAAAQGRPKYYAMYGGGTGESDTTSGRIAFSPTPNTTYKFRVHYNKMPDLLENNDTNYISMNFPNGLLYCCLSEAYGFLKGPVDMLTLYENKYKQEVQKFASEQVGRRRRDDYTDGTLRIPIPSPNP